MPTPKTMMTHSGLTAEVLDSFATIPYKEALRAVHEDRLEETKSFGGHPSRDSMPVAELEKLGALVISYLSQVGEAREHPTTGLEFCLDTTAGPLMVCYRVYHGTIISRFADPRRAAAAGVDCNPHSGKWNFHHDRGDRADRAFESWRAQLARVLT
jgi:hypothetical protein